MADVKTIDIDGIQWSIKDQEARNSLIEIKKKINVSETVLDQKGKSFISLVTINDEKFFHLHCDGDIVVSSIGQIIFNQGVIEEQMNIARCVMGGDKIDRTGRIVFAIDINKSGVTDVFPVFENKYEGEIYPCKIFGDAFVKIL